MYGKVPPVTAPIFIEPLAIEQVAFAELTTNPVGLAAVSTITFSE